MNQYKVPFIINDNFIEKKSELCIWCKSLNKKNTAHILSKTILKSEHRENKLRNSVCEKCNSFFGQNMEDWLFKYSPFNYWINNLKNSTVYIKDDKSINFKKIFLWIDEYKEWVISSNIKGEQFPTQLIFKRNKNVLLFNYRNTQTQKHHIAIDEFKKSIKNKEYTFYLSTELPPDFDPRIFCFNKKFIIVGKDKNQVENIINYNFITNSKIENIEYELSNKQHKKLVVHYKWSVKKYLKFCAKISFEFLSLFKGQDFVLSSDFDGFRTFVLHEKNDDSRSLALLNGVGLMKNRLTVNGWVSICDNVNISKDFQIPTFLLDIENNYNFSLILYKVKDYMCASIKLFDIEVCNIILAETKQPLESIFLVTYCYSTDKFNLYEGAGINEKIDKEVVFVLNDDCAKFIN